MPYGFIIGKSGTGKTAYINKEAVRLSMEGRRVVLLLPEQFNLSAERALIKHHPLGGSMDISVLSFTRLAFMVFDELNVYLDDIIDDYGQSMLLADVLERKEKELTFYSGMVGKLGFVDELKSIFSEFNQYLVNEDKLDEIIASVDEKRSLHHKMSDLGILFKEFNETIKDKYIVAEKLLAILSEVMEDSKLFSDAVFFFDGFTGFTPLQYSVIETMMKMGLEMHFSFTMDPKLYSDNDFDDRGLFHMSENAISRINRIASKVGDKMLQVKEMNENYRLKGRDEFLHLEENLFKYPGKTYDKEVSNIHLYHAYDRREEINGVCSMIKDMVISGKCRYKDIAVLCGDLENDNTLIKRYMAMNEIPYFMDCNESLICNPVYEITKGLFDLFEQDFSYDSVFKVLKSGIFDIGQDQINLLENYVLATGKRGYSAYSNTFKGNMKGLGKINAVRKEFASEIEDLAKVFTKSKAFADEYLRALYGFLDKRSVAKLLHERAGRLNKEGEYRIARAYDKAYDRFIDIFDETYMIFEGKEIKRNDLLEILKVGMFDVHLTVLPATMDQVIVGDLERTRFDNPKVLFVIGMNEGIIPLNGERNGLLAPKDRKMLSEMSVELAPDGEEHMLEQPFYFYMQLLTPLEEVYLSYSEMGKRNEAMQPSYYLNRIKKIFPEIEVLPMSDYISERIPGSLDLLRESAADHLMNKDYDDGRFLSYLINKEVPLSDKILEGFFYDNHTVMLDKDMMKDLAGTVIEASVSKLETYSSCAFRYFIQYGLKVNKRKEYKVESSDAGTILHAVMENYFKGVKDGTISVGADDIEERHKVVEDLVKECAFDHNNTIFDDTVRGRHKLDTYKRIASRCIDNLCRHFEIGSMRPEFFERKFSHDDGIVYSEIPVSPDVAISLRGVVDRVDVAVTDDKVYYRIVDYKSGNKKLDYTKIYSGQQLQLIVYMSVMEEILSKEYPGKEIVPTGMFYYHMQDNFVEGNDPDKVEEARKKNNRLKGFINMDGDSPEILDGRTGEAVDINYNKNGSVRAGTKTCLSTEEMNKLSKFVRDKICEMGSEIADGNIVINPLKGDKNGSCIYCDYKHICRFNPGYGVDSYRPGLKLKEDEAKKKIMGED